MAPRKRKRENEGLEQNVYTNTSKGHVYYYWQHPLLLTKEPLGTDKNAANVTARALNKAIAGMGIDPGVRAEKVAGITVASLVEEYRPVSFKKLKPTTRKAAGNYLERITGLFGNMIITRVTVKDLSEGINDLPDTVYIKMRTELIKLFDYALSRGYIPHHMNSPARVLEKKSEPKAKRQRLEVTDLERIFKKSPDWLKVAIELMLHTGMRPDDVINLRYSDVADGSLTSEVRKTDKFLGLELDDYEKEIIRRSRQSGIASPYIVHRLPKRRTGKPSRTKDHPTQLTLDLLSRTFSEIRDELEIGKNKKGTPPTLYEMRSLAGRLYKAEGRSDEEIQDIYAHATVNMTRVYLDPRDGSAPANLKRVKAGLKFRF